MTHDELVNEVVYGEQTRFALANALRAVVELCDKWETKGSYCLPIDSVIQAIEKELSNG